VTVIETINAARSGDLTDRPVAVDHRVVVRTRYMGEWSAGFTVAEHVDQGCLIRRLSDGSILPDVFAWSDVRAAYSLTSRGRGTGAWPISVT
jgi:hypothetical protein